MEVYAFAASLDLEDLARASSAHLLSLALYNLTDDQCSGMGPIYLRRLFFLHLGRIEALKKLLFISPANHEPTALCQESDQSNVARAWSWAISYFIQEARPDITRENIENALLPLRDHLWCDKCRDNLTERIDSLTTEWDNVKMTI